MKLVSIVVPVYNRNSVIEKSYLSLVSQTYRNIEIIFVDVGSTDNSLEIINKFKDNRVVVFSKRNYGLAEARRYGIKKSSGDYILFVDCGDCLSKDYIYKLVKSIEYNNGNIAVGRIGVHYYPFIALKARRRIKNIDLRMMKEYLPVVSSLITGKLFKKELLDLRKSDCVINEDSVEMYLMYINSRKIVVVNDAIYHYYIYKDSKLKKKILEYDVDNLLNTLVSLKCLYEELERIDKLEEYFYEIEMIFIKDISERICGIIQVINDRIYRYKFISVILDYLEYFFPDWEKNPYYVSGFKMGEVIDILYVRKAYKEICNIKRKRLNLSIDEIYDRYEKVVDMYNKSMR